MVSYSKLIMSQKFRQSRGGVVDRVKFFLSFSMITMQNLLTVSFRALYAHVADPKHFGYVATLPLQTGGVGDAYTPPIGVTMPNLVILSETVGA